MMSVLDDVEEGTKQGPDAAVRESAVSHSGGDNAAEEPFIIRKLEQDPLKDGDVAAIVEQG